ncbi:MAG TPA: acyloxyacyl hydrolase [Candidatus Acidoferrales bacterium]|nr:acyloxyacyl hydrolase [Candidatus Acidoferrales bacterium]
MLRPCRLGRTWILFLCCAVATTAVAQRSRPGDVGYGVNAGFSPFSTELIGSTKHRKLLLVNGELNLVLLAGKGTALRYTPELTFALVHDPKEYLTDLKTMQDIYSPGGYAVGGGASPLGLQLNFRDRRRVQPYIAGHGGMLYFNKQVPETASSQFNFSFSWEAGVEWRANGRNWLRAGYRYHHISNDSTGHFNPGIDSNVFLFGWTRRKR